MEKVNIDELIKEIGNKLSNKTVITNNELYFGSIVFFFKHGELTYIEKKETHLAKK